MKLDERLNNAYLYKKPGIENIVEGVVFPSTGISKLVLYGGDRGKYLSPPHKIY